MSITIIWEPLLLIKLNYIHLKVVAFNKLITQLHSVETICFV